MIINLSDLILPLFFQNIWISSMNRLKDETSINYFIGSYLIKVYACYNKWDADLSTNYREKLVNTFSTDIRSRLIEVITINELVYFSVFLAHGRTSKGILWLLGIPSYRLKVYLMLLAYEWFVYILKIRAIVLSSIKYRFWFLNRRL